MEVLSHKEFIGRFALAAVALGLALLAIAAPTARAETASGAAVPPAPPSSPSPAGGISAAAGTVASVPAAATGVPVPVEVETTPVVPEVEKQAPTTTGDGTPQEDPVTSPASTVEHVVSAESAGQSSTEDQPQALDRAVSNTVSTAVASVRSESEVASTAIAHVQSTPEVLRQAPGVERVLQATPGGERAFEFTEAAIAELTEPITDAISSLAGSIKLDLSLPVEAPTAPMTSGSAPAAGTHVPPVAPGGHLAGAPLAGADDTGVAGMREMYSAGSASESSPLRPHGVRESSRSVGPMPTARGYSDSAVGRSNDRAPLDVPISPPGLPAAVAGSSGSIFIPIVALLALLALAAPAIGRRLREAPGFRAPTPFVCALERPG